MILEGKTVIVSGVGPGLGGEVARLAVRDGANVVVAARSADKLAAAASELDASGDRVLAVPTDITELAGCEALVAAAVERFGALHGVAQVAAVDTALGNLAASSDDDWRRCFDTNVVGSMNLVRAAAPALRDAGGGAVVLIGSQSALLPPKAMPRSPTPPPRARSCRPCTTWPTSSARTTSGSTRSSRRGCGARPCRCTWTGSPVSGGSPRTT